MDDLPLQVRLVDHVRVDDPERPDACRGEVQRRRRSEAAGSDEENAGVQEALLTFLDSL